MHPIFHFYVNLAFADVMSSIENARPFFPSFDDYKGAMNAIFRLQDTYHLRADSLADGIVPGTGKATGLSTSDMFELGQHAYELRDWFHTKGWMEACLKKMGPLESKDGIRRFDVLDYLGYAEYSVSIIAVFLSKYWQLCTDSWPIHK